MAAWDGRGLKCLSVRGTCEVRRERSGLRCRDSVAQLTWVLPHMESLIMNTAPQRLADAQRNKECTSSGLMPKNSVSNGLSTLMPGFVCRSLCAGLRSPRFWLLAVGYLMLFSLIYWLAYVLRFDSDVPFRYQIYFWNSLPWLLGVKFVVFYASGHYHGWWRYVTFSDLTALMRASLVSFLVLAAIDYLVSAYFIPRGVLVLDAMLSILILGSLRASWRLAREQFRSLFGSRGRVGVLMAGADDTTALLAHQIQSHPDSKYRVRGFLESNGAPTCGRRLGQIPVVGRIREAATVAAELGVNRILMLSKGLPDHQLHELMKQCDEFGMELKIIPRMEDLLNC